MSLVPGARLGVYEVMALIGAGGMGEVYRARDARLSRDVAVKVLNEAATPERMRRLAEEARLAGSLSHPNLVTVHDVGTHDGQPFVVLELLDGESLRERLGRGPLPPGDSAEIAARVAEGLAVLHERRIVHRDLKPENVFLTRSGQTKILDFGLARRDAPDGAPDETSAVTRTAEGRVLGTPAYMSPEQVEGRPADARSDVFSLGVVLHEMLGGTNPFRRATAAESMTAILRDEPPLPERPDAPPALGRVLARCLRKRPDERFQSAADLAFALRALVGTESRVAARSTGRGDAGERRPRVGALVAGVVVAAAGILGGGWLAVRRAPVAPPSFEQLAFRRGSIGAARFLPEGETVLYSAAFDGGPPAVYSGRVGSPESRTVDVPSGEVFGISPTELALGIGSQQRSGPYRTEGSLARVPLAGGAPRVVADKVVVADWSPDGRDLALVRVVPTGHQLEYPVGHVIEQTGALITYLRVSPDGGRIAVIECPNPRYGDVVVLDRAGKRTVLAQDLNWPLGVAWDPDGSRVWYTLAEPGGAQSIRTVTLDRRDRVVYRVPGYATLHDVSRDGRVLFATDEYRVEAMARPSGASREREVSWFDVSNVTGLSRDGRLVTLGDVGVSATRAGTAYLRATDGSPAIRLGDGFPIALSPDGSHVVLQGDSTARVVSTGAGEAVALPDSLARGMADAEFFPDGRRLVVTVTERGGPRRCLVVDLPTGESRPLTPAGNGASCGHGSVSPDGRWVLATGTEGTSMLPVAGGEPRRVVGLRDGETPQGWSADGRAVFAANLAEIPARVVRVDVDSGRRAEVLSIAPPDRIGVLAVDLVALTGDAGAYAYSFVRHTSALYVATGLR